MKNSKILRLREYLDRLPSAPCGEKLITASAVQEFVGIPANTIHAAVHYHRIKPKIRLAGTILFSVEDLIALFLRPVGRPGRKPLGGIEL